MNKELTFNTTINNNTKLFYNYSNTIHFNNNYTANIKIINGIIIDVVFNTINQKYIKVNGN